MLLGVDYSDEYLELETNEAKKKHILSGHLSLDVAKEFVKVTDRDKTLKNLIIGHLSQDNSNEEKFREELGKVTNANIDFARKGRCFLSIT
jgi:phosphoribosyl 1,2-cyclic phosphodiesterase